jgi:hypothetical protein
MTEQEYIFAERLAILGCYGEPTPEQTAMALADVERYERELITKDWPTNKSIQ